MTRSANARNRIEWALLCAALLAMAALLAYFAYLERKEIGREQGDRLQVQARVVADNVQHQFVGAANALSGIRNDLLRWRDGQMQVERSRRLVALADAMPGVRTMHIVNAAGKVLDSNRDDAVGRDVTERDFFRIPQAHPDKERLYVSPPFTAPSGAYVLNLTRVLTGSRGEFAGVVTASLDPDYFNVLLRSVLYAPDMRVALAHWDGKVFMFMPPRKDAVGMDLAQPGSFFSRHRASGEAATLFAGGSVVAGDERLMASRTINLAGAQLDKPLVVHVSRDLGAIYQPWRAEYLAYGAVYALMGLTAVVVLYLVQRRRRIMDGIAIAREAERQESAERLALALAGADLGLWDWHVPSGSMTLNDRWYAMLGYARAEVPPDISSWEKLVHPEDRLQVQAALDRHFRGETPAYATEHRLRHKDGHWLWILDRGKVVERDAAGAPLRMVGTYMDISERKRTEQEREQYFRFFELSLDPMCIADPFGCFKQVNPAFMKLTGYEEGELLARPFSEFILPEDRERTAEEMKLQVGTRPSIHFENRYMCKDGRVVPLTWTAYYDAKGGVTYATARDLSEQQRREQEYRSIIQASIDGFWVTDFSGRILEVNAAICTMLGYTAEELAGMHLSDIEAVETQQEIAESVRRVVASGNAHFQGKHRRKDGGINEVDVSVLYVPALGQRLFAFVRDVTERNKAEQELRHSVAFRELLSEATPLPVYHKDASGRYTGCNSAFARFIGKRREEIVGRTLFDVAPQDLARIYLERDRELLTGASGSQVYEGGVAHADGTIHDVIFHKARMSDDAGQPIGLIGVITDLTELKKTQARRDQLEDQLRQSQKMEALGTLAGGVAHDFNNIIAAIMGNTELARQDVGPGHAALESLDEIRKASRRAKDLVQQILAFGRRQKSLRRVTSLAPVVEESTKLLRTTLPAGVRLAVACAPDAPLVLADATQMEQVLLNLCSNAWQAVQAQSRPGEVEVLLQSHRREAVRAQETGLSVAYGELPPGLYACLTVRDNGCGMDRETLGRIFEPFFTTKPVDKGTGLGLAVVHGIVQEHDGAIEVRSVPGAGSTFRVYLPAADAALQVSSERTPGSAPAHGEGKRVLFVDDDESIVFLVTRLLERQGYQVSGFTDARVALAAARADPARFDLAVTDYNMPGMSGLDVARALREIRADLPVAVASGYITDELRANAPNSGVKELIYKPNTVEELCDAVARLAGRLPA